MPEMSKEEELLNKTRLGMLFKTTDPITDSFKEKVAYESKLRIAAEKQHDDSSFRILEKTEVNNRAIEQIKLFITTLWVFTPKELEEFLTYERERWEHERTSSKTSRLNLSRKSRRS